MKRALSLALTTTAPDWVDVVRPWLVIGCGLALVLAGNPFPF